MTLPHRLDRTILISAPRDVVYSFFTDNARWSAWWGAGSTIDPAPGGAVLIRYPGGVEVTGEVVEASRPDRIVFTYGYASGTPIPAGGSLVTIVLEAEPSGTRVRLTHQFAEAAVRDVHVQGWRYQLSVFANVVSDHVHADAAAFADAWLALWSEPDADARAMVLDRIASADVTFRDRFSCIDGAAELSLHIGAAQRFMPGLRLSRQGDPRHCQGTLLVDWHARDPNDQDRGSGTNVFVLGADGRIVSATGIWAPARA